MQKSIGEKRNQKHPQPNNIILLANKGRSATNQYLSVAISLLPAIWTLRVERNPPMILDMESNTLPWSVVRQSILDCIQRK